MYKIKLKDDFKENVMPLKDMNNICDAKNMQARGSHTVYSV